MWVAIAYWWISVPIQHVMVCDVRILFIGDIVAKQGVHAVQRYLANYRDDYDFVVANGENCAGGRGITRKYFQRLRDVGVDVVTLGNHTWDNADVTAILSETTHLLRPLNYPRATPGLGYASFDVAGERVTVISVIGRIFMEPYDSPFAVIDDLLETLPRSDTIIVDFHAEATSEKKIMGYHLRGRVAAVIGTHTHVQTADEFIAQGTAYLTDAGMTGVQDSAIGMRYEEVHYRFTKQLPKRFSPAEGVATLCGVVLELSQGRAQSIERLQWVVPEDL